MVLRRLDSPREEFDVPRLQLPQRPREWLWDKWRLWGPSCGGGQGVLDVLTPSMISALRAFHALSTLGCATPVSVCPTRKITRRILPTSTADAGVFFGRQTGPTAAATARSRQSYC